jgi:translocator protein
MITVMTGNTSRQWVNVVMLVATVAVNALANALPINGQNTGAVSDRFQVLFVPAGYVFSIWGLIYVALFAFAVYQALPSQRDNPRLSGIGYLFVLSCAANIAWIFLWHYNFFAATVVVMLVLLLTLIAIYLRMGIGRVRVSGFERWLVHAPFSLYLGWISVATIANVTSYLDYIRWDALGISAEVWAIALLIIATALGALMAYTRGDFVYSLVLVWAFVGISVKQAGVVPVVEWGALVLAALLFIVMVVGTFSYSRASVRAGRA